MTTRSLGSLTLDLIAKIGGFESGMDRAARTADRKGREIERAMKDRAKAVEGAFSNLGGIISGAIGGISVGTVVSKFIQETKQAEQEQSQLAAVLKSTGESAGWSQERLNEMAEALAKASTFGAGDINQAQVRLLSYTGIVGEQVPKAMQAVLDMSTRLGMDLNQSAETIGKALDVPSQGLTALSKQGFRFTDDQKKLVEQLERTGKTAEAQGIILKALESSYGGAAAAARDTFGGAVAALQETINDLLTGSDGSMVKLKESVETLNSTMTSASTRQAFQTLTTWLAELSSAAIRAGADIVNVLSSQHRGGIVGDFLLSEFGVGGREKGDRLAGSNVKALTNDIEIATRELNRATAAGDQAAMGRANKALDEFRARKNYWQGVQREQALALVDGYQDGRIAAVTPREDDKAVKGGSVSPSGGGGRRGGGRAAGTSDFQRTLDALEKELGKTKELTRHEQLLADIQAGRIKGLLPAQREQLEILAKQVDAQRVATAASEREAEFQRWELDHRQERINTTLEETDAMRERNSQMELEIEVLGLNAEAVAAVEKARNASLITLKEAKLASAESLGLTEAETEALRQQIDLLNKRNGLIDKKALREAGEESVKFWDEAEKNMQRSIGDGLYNIADGNFKKIGQSFLDTVRRMAADAAAAQLMKHLFGGKAGGDERGSLKGLFGAVVGGLTGGWQAGAANAVTAMGGDGLGTFINLNGWSGRAYGGPVAPNGLYEVNERGDPEMLRVDGRDFLLMGRQSGEVIPAEAMGFGAGRGNQVKPLQVYNNTRGRIDSARYEQTPQGPVLTLEEVEAQLDNPNSGLSRRLDRNYRMQRRR